MGLAANQLTRYLSALQDLGLVQRVVPVTERLPEKSKKGIYQVADNFLRLWFGCVAPYESLVEFGKIREAELLMQSRLIAHTAWSFEEACRQFVEDRAAQYGALKVGRYWDRSLEIDVVGVDEKSQVVLAGECKWSAKPLGLEVVRELQRKVAQVWPERQAAMTLLFFSAGGFSAEVKRWAARSGAILVGCEDLGSV
jgi:AAA+ ATPase superfamily predicted ATPase